MDKDKEVWRNRELQASKFENPDKQSGNSFRLPHPETERSCYVGWLVSLIQHITSAERTAVGLPQRHQGAGEESENGL